MKTTLTSKNLEILYNMACQMAPFNTLPMPKSSKVRFKVIKDPTIYGCFEMYVRVREPYLYLGGWVWVG
jgi:hypothetical protein